MKKIFVFCCFYMCNIAVAMNTIQLDFSCKKVKIRTIENAKLLSYENAQPKIMLTLNDVEDAVIYGSNQQAITFNISDDSSNDDVSFKANNDVIDCSSFTSTKYNLYQHLSGGGVRYSLIEKNKNPSDTSAPVIFLQEGQRAQ